MKKIAEINNYSKHFGLTKALNKVHFDLEIGKVYGLVGHNGCGKTTLIKSMLGLLKPTTGTIKIFDKNVHHDQLGGIVGYVPEILTFPKSFNAYEYLYYCGLLYGIEDDILKKRIHELIEKLNLTYVLYKKPYTFSTGMKKKMAIIQAMLNDIKIMFLDEPTANLDPQTRQEILELIRFLANEKNVTILISSHNLDELEKFVDEVIILNKGVLTYQGRVNVDNYQKNLIEYELETSNDSDALVVLEENSNVKILSESPIIFKLKSLDYLQNIQRKLIDKGIIIYKLVKPSSDLYDIYNKYSHDRGDLSENI